jgi:anti-sigma B factor antagonist
MTSLTNEQPYLSIESTQYPEQIFLRCVGEIDPASADCLLRALTTAILSGALDVTVDLRGVEFMDSAGLRVLVEVHYILRGKGRSLQVLVTPRTAKLFHLLKLDDLLPIRAEHPVEVQMVA